MKQEAAALTATEVALMLEAAAQNRGLQFTIAPGPTMTPHQEPPH